MTVRWAALIVALLLRPAPAESQPDSAESASLAIEINLELHRADQWQTVDNQTVFHNNDEIRFRFRTSFSGYLYVLNRTSGGETVWLFPRPGQGQTSRVEAGPDYLVPGTKGSFAVGGAPGFDVTYWVLSPVAIESRATVPPAFGSQPNSLVPRCRTGALQARGICTDERAGPRPTKRAEDAPIALPASGRPIARDLQFHSEAGSTHITAPNVRDRIVVYEFHIAHR
jgi:hypothetical protein